MGRFDKTIATAQKLIAKNGEKSVWRVIDDPAPNDVNQPWNPGEATPVDNDVVICFLPLDKSSYETFGLVKGTELPKGAVMGLMGSVIFDPNIKDVVIRDGKEMRIETINTLAPNGQKILHTILFKQ